MPPHDDLAPANLRPAAEFALAVAVGCAVMLNAVCGFVTGLSPRSPVIEAAVAVTIPGVVSTYLMGCILVCFHMTRAAVAPGYTRRIVPLACFLAFALVVVFAAFLFLVAAAGWRPEPGFGLPPPT